METEIRAIQTILEKGDRIEIPSPFFYHRWFGRKRTLIYQLRDPTAATCLEALEMRLSMGVTDEQLDDMSIDEALAFKAKHGHVVADIIALVIKRGDPSCRISLKRLSGLLLKNYPFSWLLDKMVLITIAGLEDFTITIGLTQAIRLTKPSDPSQSEKRRQRS